MKILRCKYLQGGKLSLLMRRIPRKISYFFYLRVFNFHGGGVENFHVELTCFLIFAMLNIWNINYYKLVFLTLYIHIYIYMYRKIVEKWSDRNKYFNNPDVIYYQLFDEENLTLCTRIISFPLFLPYLYKKRTNFRILYLIVS